MPTEILMISYTYLFWINLTFSNLDTVIINTYMYLKAYVLELLKVLSVFSTIWDDFF